MCGPLLRYDTVIDNVWHGAAMIVTADAGSQYSPGPVLTLSWDPEVSVSSRKKGPANIRPHPSLKQSRPRVTSFDIQPFDPHAVNEPTPPLQTVEEGSFPLPSYSEGGYPNGNGHSRKPSRTTQERKVDGREIWVYNGASGTFTFWRFMLEIPLANVEMPVQYCINNGALIEFVVPAIGQNMRWTAHSVRSHVAILKLAHILIPMCHHT